ncbi:MULTISPECIES: hypothetical protein [Cryobacterium]|uniref:hypothetical protein n=1 Tax=Cryobacterium TaxID=69578 RepID=UPI0018E094D2|nr:MULTISPECIES: hypothetical protein [Cryobacterium]
MIRFLIRTAIFLGSGTLGLWVASLVLDGFTLTWQGWLAGLGPGHAGGVAGHGPRDRDLAAAVPA